MIFTQVNDSIQLHKQHQKKKYSRSTTPTTKSRFNFTGGFAGKVPSVDTEEVISFVRNEKVIPSYKVYYSLFKYSFESFYLLCFFRINSFVILVLLLVFLSLLH
jgi:hypothetical protein